MSIKRAAIGILLAGLLAIAVAWYAFVSYGAWAIPMHMEGAATGHMMSAYDRLSDYRKRNGRWPQDLSVVMGETGLDPSSYRPLLYFPDAKPGTKAILLAQPEGVAVGLWPLNTIKRKGVRADGELVDVRGDERQVVESK